MCKYYCKHFLVYINEQILYSRNTNISEVDHFKHHKPPVNVYLYLLTTGAYLPKHDLMFQVTVITAAKSLRIFFFF